MQLVPTAQGHPTTEEVLPQHPVGVNPQQRLAQGDEACHAQDEAGMEILNLGVRCLVMKHTSGFESRRLRGAARHPPSPTSTTRSPWGKRNHFFSKPRRLLSRIKLAGNDAIVMKLLGRAQERDKQKKEAADARVRMRGKPNRLQMPPCPFCVHK
jgi:hypothetical protein